MACPCKYQPHEPVEKIRCGSTRYVSLGKGSIWSAPNVNGTSQISRSSFRAWLQLLRLPNLFTVPGDPLAGFLLAWDGKRELSFLALAIAVSLCFYGAGLLWNDLADRAVDRAERPQRPLPSGAVKTRSVWIVSFILAGAALVIS